MKSSMARWAGTRRSWTAPSTCTLPPFEKSSERAAGRSKQCEVSGTSSRIDQRLIIDELGPIRETDLVHKPLFSPTFSAVPDPYVVGNRRGGDLRGGSPAQFISGKHHAGAGDRSAAGCGFN